MVGGGRGAFKVTEEERTESQMWGRPKEWGFTRKEWPIWSNAAAVLCVRERLKSNLWVERLEGHWPLGEDRFRKQKGVGTNWMSGT